MAKPMEDRITMIGPIYNKILGSYPILKKGLFSPDLAPLCARYDKGVKDFKVVIQKKANLSVFLGQFGLTITEYMKDVDANNNQRVKVRDDCLNLINSLQAKLRGFGSEDEKADPVKVMVALKDYAAANKSLNVQNAAYRDKNIKMEDQLDVNLKKICDNYEKASAEVKNTTTKLEADADTVEAQVRTVVLSYKKIAVKADQADLAGALDQVTAAFP